MRNTRAINSLTNKNAPQTSLVRKLARLAQDPIRLETGVAPANLEIYGIKAVRLG